MIKKTTLIALVLGLFLVVISPVAVHAQSQLAILNTSAQIQFPANLTFNISARSDVNITDVRLHYWVDQRHFAEVTSEAFVDVTPATTVNTKWVWDMRRGGGLPPGAMVNYQWIVKDARGDKVESSPARVPFHDTRYSWQSLSENRVTLFWYQGSNSFARDLMGSAQQGIARLERDTGARLEQSVKLYIYGSSQDLQGAMIFPQDWTGGAAYSGYSIIVIGISPNQLDWGKKTITHELTHLVIDQMTWNPYNSLPTWLSEGLAMYNEGPLDRQFAVPLNQAIAKKNLISVRSLSSPFSAYGSLSVLSYAESYSIVDFLISRYGQGKMSELLLTFKEGSSYDNALKKAYGFDMDGLNNQWHRNLTQTSTAAAPATGALSALHIAGFVLVGAGFLVAVILVMRRKTWR